MLRKTTETFWLQMDKSKPMDKFNLNLNLNLNLVADKLNLKVNKFKVNKINLMKFNVVPQARLSKCLKK